MIQRTARLASFGGASGRAATIAIALSAGAAGAAACGSVGAEDLFVDDGSTTTGTGASSSSSSGATTSSSSSSSSGSTTSSSSSSSGSTTSSSSSSSSGTPPTCGDGNVDSGEECDGTDLGGSTCSDLGYSNPAGLACTAACSLDTSGCQAACNGLKAEPGEDCDGTDLNGHSCSEYGFVNPVGLACSGCQLDPSGCKPACGNGTIEPGETCDGTNIGAATCAMFGYANPAGLGCSADCASYNPAGCKASCNNGVLEPTEVCDGSNLNGQTCASFGYLNPAGLKCSNACAIDTSSCQAVCGNNKVEPGEECDDGNAQSGDGCSSTCKNEALTGATCASAIPVVATFGTATVSGSTVGGGSHSGTGAACPGFGGPDRIYGVTIQNDGFLTVSLSRPNTNFDSVLYVTQACSDTVANTSLICADSYDVAMGTGLDGGEALSLRVQTGQKYYVFVDGFAGGDSGNYQITIDLSAGNCNDPIPFPLEPGAPMRVLGSNNNTFPFTQGSCGGMPGGEVVYRVTRPDSAPITVTTDTAVTNFNAALYARSSCFAGELACSNQANLAQETITLNNVMGGTPVWVFVDGSSGTSFGNYALTITP